MLLNEVARLVKDLMEFRSLKVRLSIITVESCCDDFPPVKVKFCDGSVRPPIKVIWIGSNVEARTVSEKVRIAISDVRFNENSLNTGAVVSSVYSVTFLPSNIAITELLFMSTINSLVNDMYVFSDSVANPS